MHENEQGIPDGIWTHDLLFAEVASMNVWLIFEGLWWLFWVCYSRLINWFQSEVPNAEPE